MNKSHCRSEAILRAGWCGAVGKVGFQRKKDAKRAKTTMLARGRDVQELQPYICQHCGNYHLGTKRVLGEVLERAHHQAIARHKG